MEGNKTPSAWERLTAHVWLDDELRKGNVEYRYVDRSMGTLCALMNLFSDRERSTRGKFGVLITALILWIFFLTLKVFCVTCVVVLTLRWLAG